MVTYRSVWERSIEEPESFWAEAAKGVDWYVEPTVILDDSEAPIYKWFSDGVLNTCYNALDRHVIGGRGEQLALIYDSPVTDTKATYTYHELLDETARFAGVLRDLGIEKGDRVVIYMPMIPQAVIAMLACARLGAVHSVVFGGFAAHELALRIDDARPKVVVTASCGVEVNRVIEYKPLVDAALEEATNKPEHCVVFQRPQATAAMSEGRDVDWDEAMSRATPAECVPVKATDPLYVLYTSGTTGRPKGAALTHHGLVANARQSAALWQVSRDDRWCNPMPLFHTAGCGMVALGAVAARAAHVPLVRFDADRTLDTIERERCTVVETVPTMLTALLDRQRHRGADLSSLRLVGTSGAPTPADLGARCAAEWGVPLRVLYGSTEVSPTVSGTALDEPGDLGWTTVGRPLPGTEARVVDPATGAVCPPGVPGELQVRGYQVMRGYHNQPDATAAAIGADGWYASGDLATMDDAGYLRVTGRIRDMIIRGGENLYPAEIEQVLRQHPAVADAAVIGVPDPFFGEEACAVIVVRDRQRADAEAVRSWMRERVTHQKVPRYVRIVDALPQTASGKVQKYLLREQVATEGGQR